MTSVDALAGIAAVSTFGLLVVSIIAIRGIGAWKAQAMRARHMAELIGDKAARWEDAYNKLLADYFGGGEDEGGPTIGGHWRSRMDRKFTVVDYKSGFVYVRLVNNDNTLSQVRRAIELQRFYLDYRPYV